MPPLIELPEGVTDLRARWATEAETLKSEGQPKDSAVYNDILVYFDRLLVSPDRTQDAVKLQNQVANLEKEIEVLKNGDERKKMITDMQELHTLVAQLSKKLVDAPNTNTTPPAPTNPPDKIPNPQLFDGTRSKLRPFITQLRVKAATYSDEQAKLRLAINCLTGEALDQIQAYVTGNSINLEDLESLINILDIAFGNPNRVAEAEAKLSTIQQGNREFSTYYAEFQRYAAEVIWDEPSRLSALKRGLSYRLRQNLVTVLVQPTNMPEFVTLCNQLDNRQRQLQADSKNQPSPKRPIPATAPSTQSGTHAGPMDLSANRPKMSPEEREKRVAEGRCFRCGGLGHVSRECPLSRRGNMKAAEAKVTEVKEEEGLDAAHF